MGFEPRFVKLGVESSGEVAVLDGISAGEEVVTSAQFLVDSESKLREATAKVMEGLQDSGEGEDDAKNMKGHSGMNHSDETMIEHTPEDAEVHSGHNMGQE